MREMYHPAPCVDNSVKVSRAIRTDQIAEAPSLADQAYRAIRDRLVKLEIRPGAPINEDQLSASLGLGRTPVREALKRLELERLVIAYPRRGTFATGVNITDLTHLFEVRQLIEPAASAIAARHATAADRVAMAALLEELESCSGPPDELIDLDMQVHRTIYAATDNPYLEDTLVRYDSLAARIWCLFLDQLTVMAKHVGQHGPLLRSVIDADADKAAELARQHVTEFEAVIRSLI
jgi:DNA-binding GntR family transcriptional regulator